MRRLRELPGHSFVVAERREYLRHQSSLVTASPKGLWGADLGERARSRLNNRRDDRLDGFVHPELVDGSLAEGFRRIEALDTAWERAVLTMFVVAEVHPFDDGNGRIARIMMNAELAGGAQARIIIPTGLRTDYVGVLRWLTRQEDPSVYIKALRYAHEWTAEIDFSDFDAAVEQMAALNAFEVEDGRPLRLPARLLEEPEEIELVTTDAGGFAGSGIVPGYVRSDGTTVRGYSRRPRRR